MTSSAIHLFSIAVFPLILLSSCATPQDSSWSPEWQTIIGNVDRKPARVLAAAYQKPSGVDTGTADYVGSRVYMASGGDNIVGLVGGMVSRGIAAGQQSDFEEKNLSHFGALQQFFDSGFTTVLDQQLSAALDRTAFRNRRTAPFGALLYSDVQKCGFRRAGTNASDEVLLTPFVEMNFMMQSADAKKMFLLKTIPFDVAAEGIVFRAREFATDPAIRRRAQETMAAKIGGAFTSLLKRKLGEP